MTYSSKIWPSFAAGTKLSKADRAVLAVCAMFLAGFVASDGRATYPEPPDFSSMAVDAKKRQFFAYLSPMVSAVNFEFAADRDRIREIRAELERGDDLGWIQKRWLRRLAIRLEVDMESMPLDDALDLLERRAGIVPESIVLAQAAVESGWGTSRFARQGNNYFGQRCYTAGCGLEPRQRPEGSRFGLARYADPFASVESYMLNLNTHESYREFRLMRERLRVAGEPITGLDLVRGLSDYSERGSEYIAQLASMIRANNLE